MDIEAREKVSIPWIAMGKERRFRLRSAKRLDFIFYNRVLYEAIYQRTETEYRRLFGVTKLFDDD